MQHNADGAEKNEGVCVKNSVNDGKLYCFISRTPPTHTAYPTFLSQPCSFAMGDLNPTSVVCELSMSHREWLPLK